MPDLDKRQLLLDCARDEFLEYGYQKASLRRICKKANMTTGAIYFFFKDKADLFDELVKDVAQNAKDIINETATLEVQNNNETQLLENLFSVKLGKDLINLYFDHPIQVKLLFNKSDGSHFENFNEILQGYIEKRIRTLVELKVGKETRIFTDEMIGWLAHAETDGFLYAIHLHSTREQTLEMIENIIAYLIAGFNRLYREELEKNSHK